MMPSYFWKTSWRTEITKIKLGRNFKSASLSHVAAISANIEGIVRSVLKERVQYGIREKIKLWLLTHKQILPKVTKALFVTRENGVNSIMVNLSITIKSNQFVGNKYRASDFLKKQRNKESTFLVDTLQQKKWITNTLRSSWLGWGHALHML